MTTKITLPEHLREYLLGKYCDLEEKPVRFPDRDDLYVVLYDLLEKRPKNVPVDFGNVEIFLPHRAVGKDPLIYNYLGTRSQTIFMKKLELRMWAEVHDFMDEQKHRYGVAYIDCVHLFLNRFGITAITEEAFLKNYYRWRSIVRRKEKKREYHKKKCTEQV